MSKLQSTFAVSAFAIIGALSISTFSTSANASVTSQLLNCKYNTKQKTISCCQHVIRSEKMPSWMISAGGSCNSVVKCVGGGTINSRAIAVPPRRCYVYIPNDIDRDGGRGTPTPTRQFRTFN